MKRYMFKETLFILTLVLVFALGCKKNVDVPVTVVPPPIIVQPPVVKPDLVFFALNNNNQLLKFNANAVETPISTTSITGIQSGETILGIDFRPATGELYAITNSSRLYIINTNTGVARVVGAMAPTPFVSSFSIGFNFNPTVDRIRIVGDDGQNIRINPETGAVVATDGRINGGNNAIVSAVAYSGNTAGSGNTVLYDLDFANGKLLRQTPPNNGTLVEVGSLGVGTINGQGSFDISPSGIALAAFKVDNKNGLYQIDTTSGKASFLGNFNPSLMITSIAIPSTPVAYAVDDMNNLLIFDATVTSGLNIITKPITGLMAGENIVGLDFRPLNGQLYAVGSTSRLYTINASSGGAVVVGTGPLTTLLSGTNFGFDFNPVVDRIRVVSDNGQNLRLHPDLGTVAAIDMSLNPGTPNVSASAYTNNFAGTTTTVLFGIDHTTDKLYMQTPPNNGTLVEVGSLGINIDGANGFDIGSTTGKAYGIFTVNGVRAIYNVNLTTGAATKLIDFPKEIRGFTLGLSL